MLDEIFSNPEAVEFEKLFSRLDAEDSLQRRNALDVLTELFAICTRNSDMITSALRSHSSQARPPAHLQQAFS